MKHVQTPRYLLEQLYTLLCSCSATVHPIKVTVDPKSVVDPTLAVELYNAVDSKVIVHTRAVVIDLSGALDSRVAVGRS